MLLEALSTELQSFGTLQLARKLASCRFVWLSGVKLIACQIFFKSPSEHQRIALRDSTSSTRVRDIDLKFAASCCGFNTLTIIIELWLVFLPATVETTNTTFHSSAPVFYRHVSFPTSIATESLAYGHETPNIGQL